jgi:quercetin dioxygenase-like cupin family protein
MKILPEALTLVALTLLVGGAIVALVSLAPASATPALDFNSVVVVHTFFDKIRITTRQHGDDDAHGVGAFRAKIDVDDADVYVVDTTVPPGGNSGWHTHAGPSIVAVKSGTATVYDGDDPSCTPVTYPAGTGFVDAGGGHVHRVRNAGKVQLELIAFQTIPAGAARRIEAPDPGFCPNL